MIVGVLVPAAVLGLLVLVAVLFVQRGRDGLDLSARSLLRVYLYVASLAGVVAFAIGVASVANFALARTVGDELIYGGPVPAARPVPRCPPGATGCVEPSPQQLAEEERRQRAELERRRNEDLLRGITFTVFGLLFWGAHWVARRALEGAEGRASPLRRAYLMLGTAVFGLAALVLVPTGVYQALANRLLVSPELSFRQGADALGGAVATLPIWLLYLWLALREIRRSDAGAVPA
ncbi:MAG: DUF5671 domain-containing protein [Candidatus Limnocylindria bacterium]